MISNQRKTKAVAPTAGMLLASACALALGVPAHAQTTGTATAQTGSSTDPAPGQAGAPPSGQGTPLPTEPAAATTPALGQSDDAGSTQGLEDIIVTAQKRSERAQDVPIALTAVSGDTIAASAADDIGDITQGIVGIQYQGASTQRNEIFIRGIGTNRFDIGSEPSSGVFIDEVYQPRASNLLTGLNDIERVEVLRGPQGTLFGRNTIGGAVAVFTADPEDRFGGRLNATYGNKDKMEVNGTVSIPFSDRASVRVSGVYDDRDGFTRDTVSGRDDGVKTYGGRVKFRFEPTDTATLRFTTSYLESRQSAQLPNVERLPLFLSPEAVLGLPPGAIYPQVIDNDPFRTSLTDPGGNRIRNFQMNGRADFDIGIGTATLIASYSNVVQDPSSDLDGAQNDNLNYFEHDNSNIFSFEGRLASVAGGPLTFGDRVRWVVGVYQFIDDAHARLSFRAGPDSVLGFLVANPTLMPPFVRGSFSLTDQNIVRSDLSSTAVFGQATASLTDWLSVTAGGRYTRDRRDFTFEGVSSVPNFPLVEPSFRVGGTPVDASFDPKVGIEIKPMRDVLIYGTFSQGFKSASIQSTSTNPNAAARVTRPESVDAYEIGVKSEFLNRRVRLNVAAFWNEFSDLQVRRVVTFPDGFSTAIAENAADSTIKGVEVESSVLVTPNFRINASYAYTDAKYGTYIVDAVNGVFFSGNRLPRAPKHRFNVDGNYTLHLGTGSELDLRASYNYTSSFFFQPENLPIDREKGYGLVDLSATLRFNDDQTSIQAWGRNVTDRRYRVYLEPADQSRLAFYGDGATYGVTLGQRF